MSSNRPTPPPIPGFDFLKSLAEQAAASMEGLGQSLKSGMPGVPGMPGMGALGGVGRFQQWVAPTLDPDELEKRIEELRTVQFWLEQNTRLLGATIQALEVQKMTLSTLRSMNVAMPDLQPLMGAMQPKSAAPKGPPGPRAKASAGASSRKTKTAAGAAASAGLVDPMKWWGALTEQFQSLASQALVASPGMAAASAAAAKPADQGAGGKASAGRASAAKATPARHTARRPAR